MDSVASYDPAKGLIAGVLERAYRDLHCNEYAVFKDAMKWVLNDKHDQKECDISKEITFKDCIEILGLSAKQVEYIKQKALAYIDYLYNKHKFKLDRPSVVKIRQYSVLKKRYYSGTPKQKWRRGYTVRSK